MRTILLLSILAITVIIYGCSDKESGVQSDKRDVIMVKMNMYVPPERDNERVIMLDGSSGMNGFSKFFDIENIMSIEPLHFIDGNQTMTFTFKRHTYTKFAYGILYSGETQLFLSYEYKGPKENEPHNTLVIESTLYTDRSASPIYIQDIAVDSQTIEEIWTRGFWDWSHEGLYEDQLQFIDVSECPSLKMLHCKGHPHLVSLDLSNNPNLQEVDLTNNVSLDEVWLKTGQNIRILTKDEHTTIRYK